MPGQRLRLLVVADASDRGARAVAEVVARRHGAQAVRTVTPATLTILATWQHRIVRGRASTSLLLPDGSWLADPPAAVVLNRMRWVITPTMPSEVDRQYAVMELHALLLSWLAGLQAVVLNPPTPANLAGVGLTELDLLARLARARLPVRTLELTTRRRATLPMEAEAVPPYRRSPAAARQARVLVAGRAVHGASPSAEALCRRVADVLRCPLLELDLAREEPRGWVVAGVDPLPSLRVPAEVTAVADLVDRCAARSPAAASPPSTRSAPPSRSSPSSGVGRPSLAPAPPPPPPASGSRPSGLRTVAPPGGSAAGSRSGSGLRTVAPPDSPAAGSRSTSVSRSGTPTPPPPPAGVAGAFATANPPTPLPTAGAAPARASAPAPAPVPAPSAGSEAAATPDGSEPSSIPAGSEPSNARPVIWSARRAPKRRRAS